MEKKIAGMKGANGRYGFDGRPECGCRVTTGTTTLYSEFGAILVGQVLLHQIEMNGTGLQ